MSDQEPSIDDLEAEVAGLRAALIEYTVAVVPLLLLPPLPQISPDLWSQIRRAEEAGRKALTAPSVAAALIGALNAERQLKETAIADLHAKACWRDCKCLPRKFEAAQDRQFHTMMDGVTEGLVKELGVERAAVIIRRCTVTAQSFGLRAMWLTVLERIERQAAH